VDFVKLEGIIYKFGFELLTVHIIFYLPNHWTCLLSWYCLHEDAMMYKY
jgi:hypothetical protein